MRPQLYTDISIESQDASSPLILVEETPQRKSTARRASFDMAPRLNARELAAVAMVLLICFLDSLGSNISLPVLPFYAREFHVTSSQVGYLFSAFNVTTTLALPCLSALSDRYGRKTVLLLSLVGTAVGSISQGLAPSYAMLFLARVFCGIWAGVSSVCQVYIGDTVPEELRSGYMSYLITSNQAAILFGPSIGAGLSVMGLNYPLFTTGAVSALLVPIVWVYLPESEAWLALKQQQQQQHEQLVQLQEQGPQPGMSSQNLTAKPPKARAASAWSTKVAIGIYGGASFLGMVAQMSFVSMYAIYADKVFHLQSLQVGFILTLGATASIAANIWVSPWVQHSLGDPWASVIGSVLISIGSITIMSSNVRLSIFGVMVLFQGCAINNGAVSTGAVSLTDVENRSTVMTGVRMCKTLGSVVGPVIAGWGEGIDPKLPFVFSCVFGVIGMLLQMATMPLNARVKALVKARAGVGKEIGHIWDDGWRDEIGTPDEIADLGQFLADLLTTRHYRWVTHNTELKAALSDFFPQLSVNSPEEYQERFDWVRARAVSNAQRAELFTQGEFSC